MASTLPRRLSLAPLTDHTIPMLRTARLLGCLLLAALIVVTLAPIGLRPVSGAPVSLERFGAFAALGFLFALGYPQRRWQMMLLVIGAAAVLESLQLVEATRHGRMADFLMKAAGGGFGVGLATALAALPAFGRAPRGL